MASCESMSHICPTPSDSSAAARSPQLDSVWRGLMPMLTARSIAVSVGVSCSHVSRTLPARPRKRLALGAHRRYASTNCAPTPRLADQDAEIREPSMSVNEVYDRQLTGSDDDDVRVLLVEDDPEVAQMYRLKLELDGYLVDVASDGVQALRMATEHPPDILFLDIRLPKMDGLGVLEALRKDSRTESLPVVILSNYSEGELVERGLKLGALDYLIKSQTTPARVSGGVVEWLKN